MKLAFCTEDLSDEVFLSEFIRRLTNRELEVHSRQYRIERGGWTKALQLAPIVARDVFRSDADGVVFAIDNDDAEPLHHSVHTDSPGCRWCMLRRAAGVDEILRWERPGLPGLQFVFVVPVRTIETWLALAAGVLRERNPLSFGKSPRERRELKGLVYGAEPHDRETMMTRGLQIIRSTDLGALRLASPSFAHFADQAEALR